MKEEKHGTSKNKWSRIFQKKWFFPALYLAIAALLITGVVWYQSVENQTVDESQEDTQVTDVERNDLFDEEAEPVMDQQEIILMPVRNPEQTEIVTKFYDYNADQEDQEKGLILYNNRYYQSTGIDIVGPDGEPFEVLASLSGTVVEVKEDPLLGHVVSVEHDHDVMTYYASLADVVVKAGDEIKQGEVIGTAGKNIFGKDNGNHVHFEIRKNGHSVNPEAFFNQPVSKLDGIAEESDADVDDATDEAEETEEDTDSTDEQENEESETDEN